MNHAAAKVTTPAGDGVRVWPAALSDGVVRGTADVVAAAEVMAGELGCPTVPLVPEGGATAQPVVRTLVAAAGLGVDIGPRGFRLVHRPGAFYAQAEQAWRRDAEVIAGVWGRQEEVCVPVVGPWTAAAALELANGHKALRDPGAVRELAQAVARSAAAQVDFFAAHAGISRAVVLLGESGLGEVVRGGVSDGCRLDPVRAVPAADAGELLALVAAAIKDQASVPVRVLLRVVGEQPPWDAVQASGVEGLMLDAAATAGSDNLDALAGWWDAAPSGLDTGRSLAFPIPWRLQPAGGEYAPARRAAICYARLIDQLGLDRVATASTLIPAVAGHPGPVTELAAAVGLARRTGDILRRDAGDL